MAFSLESRNHLSLRNGGSRRYCWGRWRCGNFESGWTSRSRHLEAEGVCSQSLDCFRNSESFLEAIDSLENAETAISNLLKRAPEERLVGTEAQNTKRLASQVAACRADIDEWVNEIPIRDIDSPRAIFSFIKKLQVASHEDTYNEFHKKVARHLQAMQMTFNILGWYDCLLWWI